MRLTKRWGGRIKGRSQGCGAPPTRDPTAHAQVTKPVVAWVSGTCAKLFKSEVQFGHAGARGGGAELESAQAKNAALAAAGAVVPESFEGLEAAVAATYQRLVGEGVIRPSPDVVVPEIPMDLEAASKAGKVGVSG